MATNPTITGLPEGAVLKPIQGLPEGATLKPIQGMPDGATAKPMQEPAAAAPMPPAAQTNPEGQDQGYFHGLWSSTVGPLFDAAKANRDDIRKSPTVMDALHKGVKLAFDNTPDAIASKMVSSIIAEAYEQGKQAVHHAGNAAGEMKEEIKSLAGGNVDEAVEHAKGATGEMSEAAGHGLAAAVPAIGPAAAKTGEKLPTKPKEALGEMTGEIAQVLIPGKATGAAEKGAAAVEKTVATNEARSAAEAQAQAARSTAETTRTEATSAQLTAAQARRDVITTERTANRNIESGRATVEKKLTETQQPVEKAKAATASAETRAVDATNTASAASKAAPAQAAAANQTVQSTARKAVSDVARESTENAVKKIAETTGEKIDHVAAAKDVSGFKQAAETIQNHAKPLYEKLDKATGGRFTTLRTEINEMKEAMRKDPNATVPSGKGEIYAKQALPLAEKEFDALFKEGSGITKADADAARQAWHTSKVIEDINSAVERSVTGAPENIAQRSGATRAIKGVNLSRNLNKLLENTKQDVIEQAIGKEGFDNLYKIASLTAEPIKAAKFELVAKNVADELMAQSKQAKSALKAAEGKAANTSAHIEGIKSEAERTILTQVEAKRSAAKELGVKATEAQINARAAEKIAASKELASKALQPETKGSLGRRSLTGTVGAIIGYKTGGPMMGAVGAGAGVAVSEGLSKVYHAALSNPRVGKLLRDAADAGTTAKVYVPLITQAMNTEAKKEIAKTKEPKKK